MESLASAQFCVLMFMGSVAMWAGANHLPSEQGSPSGEGTSIKAISLPPLLLKGTEQGNCPRTPQST